MIEYQERLKGAEKSKDFQNILNEYQDAQARVDKEMSSNRKKEVDRLDKALKARKAAIKAKNEAKLRERQKEIDREASEINARSKDGQM